MGDEDYMFLPQVMQLVRNHANSSLQIVPDCGHVCNVEQPDYFNNTAINFISSNS
jgi:pimeloyl-ACP methyl ester carboxylesterase